MSVHRLVANLASPPIFFYSFQYIIECVMLILPWATHQTLMGDQCFHGSNFTSLLELPTDPQERARSVGTFKLI